MNNITTLITEYLDLCRTQKCLDEKVLKDFREPIILPKTILLHSVENFLSTIYAQCSNATSTYCQ